MSADLIAPTALRFERRLTAPPQAVWHWLVEPALRARWFMTGRVEPRVGGALGMRIDADALSDGPTTVPERHRGDLLLDWAERITRYDPPHRLAFTWDGGAAGAVTIALAEDGDGTRLVLDHAGLRGAADAHAFATGWLAHLAALERRLTSRPVDFWALHDDAEAQAARVLAGA
jgi:uncharacterized protein YndB with AHSA1/START domain